MKESNIDPIRKHLCGSRDTFCIIFGNFCLFNGANTRLCKKYQLMCSKEDAGKGMI
jgi:hypothetical protein